MIDAINFYSSTHAGRKNESKNSNTFGRLYKTEADYFLAQKISLKQPNLASAALVGGCAAAMSMIIDTIFSSTDLIKGNLSKVSDIFRHAGVMAVIGGVLYGGAKFIEHLTDIK